MKKMLKTLGILTVLFAPVINELSAGQKRRSVDGRKPVGFYR